MRRIIDFSLMGEIALNLKQQIEELKKERNMLLLNVNKIPNNYKGKDSTALINNYELKIKEIDKFIKIMEEYQICFEWLAGNYKDSHDIAQNNLETILSNLTISDEINKTINLDNLVGGDNNE